MAGFEQLHKQIETKKSHVVLGLDPTSEMGDDIAAGGGARGLS